MVMGNKEDDTSNINSINDDFFNDSLNSLESNSGEQNLLEWTIVVMYEFKMSYKDVCDLPINVFSEIVKFLQKRYSKLNKSDGGPIGF